MFSRVLSIIFRNCFHFDLYSLTKTQFCFFGRDLPFFFFLLILFFPKICCSLKLNLSSLFDFLFLVFVLELIFLYFHFLFFFSNNNFPFVQQKKILEIFSFNMHALPLKVLLFVHPFVQVLTFHRFYRIWVPFLSFVFCLNPLFLSQVLETSGWIMYISLASGKSTYFIEDFYETSSPYEEVDWFLEARRKIKLVRLSSWHQQILWKCPGGRSTSWRLHSSTGSISCYDVERW